jgi:HlyD family secretion protein
MNAAVAAQLAASQKVAEAEHALNAVTHDVELYRVNILDNTLVAPRDGPIEYRVANVGEVLPAGGKVFYDARCLLCLFGYLLADR